MSSFQINVADLRRSRATDRDVLIDAEVDWALELSRVAPSTSGEPNIHLMLTLSPVGGGLLVRGSAKFDVAHACHRCLAERVEEAEAQVMAMFTASAGDEDGTFLLDDVIDLEPAVRDDVLLSMPLLPVCVDGCESQPGGDSRLVGHGETDLNTGRSGYESAVTIPEDGASEASPFAVLRDLLDSGD